MPRRETPFLSGEHYHLYNRGVNRGKIFFEHRNYQFLLFNLERYMLPYSHLLAYCLMPTHYHFLICVKDKKTTENGKKDILSLDISKAMMKFSVSYTKAVNHKYDRVGPLFQGSFQSKHINSYDYYLQVINYIHENPVESNLVADSTEWLYSSIHDYLGKEEFGLIDIDLGGPGNLGGLRV